MNEIVRNITKPTVTIKTVAMFMAVASAVALPQLFHTISGAVGLETALGEIFLPMHLPVLLLGFFAGRYFGAAAGLIAPLLSFATTGMPGAAMLPFITVELCVYGFASGALKDKKINLFSKVALSQLAGRLVRAVVIAIAIYGFKYTKIDFSVVLTSIVIGLPGIIFQLIIVPFVVSAVKRFGDKY